MCRFKRNTYYKTKTWKQRAEVPIAKFVREKRRVNFILMVRRLAQGQPVESFGRLGIPPFCCSAEIALVEDEVENGSSCPPCS